jgi:TonB family protein
MKPVAGTPVASNTDATPTQPSAPLDRDSLKNLRDRGSNGSIAGGADGTGSHGIGGQGTGSITDGLGTRGWAVRARANYPEGSNATGAVTLRFTVLPNGEITNITPAKRADQALVSAAISGLKRARANPLPESVAQVPQQGWVTFTFTLKQ